MQIAGLDQLIAEMQQLPDVFQSRLMKGTVATGASVIRKEAIQRAPLYTGDVQAGHPPPGTLKKSIYQTRLVAECTPTVETWKVDVRMGNVSRTSKGGKTTVKVGAYYAIMVERGTVKMTAKPFMRPALETKANEAFQAMQQYLSDNLPAAVQGMRYIQAKEGA